MTYDRTTERAADRAPWRSEGRDWRGAAFQRYGREDFGHVSRGDAAGPGATRAPRQPGFGYEGYGREGYDYGREYWRAEPESGAGRTDTRPDHRQERARRGPSWEASGDYGQDFGTSGTYGRPGHRGRGPRGYVRPAERIREDVNDRLTEDPYIDATDIEVGVDRGEVTLAGTVDSRRAKHRAEDIAESVSGVTHVQNNLRLRQATSAMR